jgi:hypothetical protein
MKRFLILLLAVAGLGISAYSQNNGTYPYNNIIVTGNSTVNGTSTISGASTFIGGLTTTPPAYTGGTLNIVPNIALQDDFLGNTPATTTTVGQLGWDITVLVTGTNPVAAAASVANHPGLITLTTDTTATNGVGITLGHGVGVLFPGASTNWSAEWVQEINQVATGSYRIGFGTVDTTTAIPTNGIYFRFLQGTDTYINACSDTTSTETCTPTTVAPTAADYVDLYMTSSTTGAVTFTVKDVTTPATSTVTLCPAGCTAVATVPTVVLSPMFNIAETGSSAADVLTVDYFGLIQTAVR